MADLDTEVNKAMASYLRVNQEDLNQADKIAFYFHLLMQIVLNSAGRLRDGGGFLTQTLRNPEKGPLLQKKLAEAWHEKKYQSIRDIGKIYWLMPVVFVCV
jgi:hypothetical protein